MRCTRRTAVLAFPLPCLLIVAALAYLHFGRLESTSMPSPHAGVSIAHHQVQAQVQVQEAPSLQPPASGQALAGPSSSSSSHRQQHLGVHPFRFHCLPPKGIPSSLKIFVYPLPPEFNALLLEANRKAPPEIRDPSCESNFYSAEVAFHSLLLASPHRTTNPRQADLFYVPVYSTCYSIQFALWNMTASHDFHERALAWILKLRRDAVPRNYNPSSEEWNMQSKLQPLLRSGDYPEYPPFGKDHVWMFSQGFGARLFGQFDKINKGVFLLANGQLSAPDFNPLKDITFPPRLAHYVPEPLYRSFRSQADVDAFVEERRAVVATFAGTKFPCSLSDDRGACHSRGVRPFLKQAFQNSSLIRILGIRSREYFATLRQSTFCLCPEGWHAWTPRVFEAVLLGCIPVVISDDIVLPFEDKIDYDAFVVRIRPAFVEQALHTTLVSIPHTEIAARRRAMLGVWKRFEWNDVPEEGDAFCSILEALFERKSRESRRWVLRKESEFSAWAKALNIV